MLTQEMEQFGRRAVEAPAFQWMLGMKTQLGVVTHILVSKSADRLPWITVADEYCSHSGPPDELVIDPNDPATRGCLFYLIASKGLELPWKTTSEQLIQTLEQFTN